MSDTKTVVVSFSATPDFRDEVRAAAQADDRSFSSFIRAAVRTYLARQEENAV